ncbi:hypothetical protein EJB05_55256, partial [Eragrostis curvula]
MSLLLPCLLFFLGVHVSASHGAPLPSTVDSICSESFRCGGVEISYPFYLVNATPAAAGYGSHYSCGYTDLKILCQDVGKKTETAIIQLGPYSYMVKNISYHNDTILLADADAFRGGNGGCPVIRHNVTFGTDWLRLRYTGAFDNLTFFSSCNLSGDVLSGLEAYQIGCPGLGGGASFVFLSDQHDASGEHDLADQCRDIVVVPVLSDSLARMSDRSALPREYGGVLRQGFELAWSGTTTDDCYRCEKSGGRCSYSQDKVFRGCLCSDNKVAAPDCSNSTASTTRSPSNALAMPSCDADIVASTSCLLLLCLIILALYSTHKYGSLGCKTKDAPRIESFLQKNGNIHPKRYTYAEVKRMTKSFAVKLGQGGFGTVYKGNLPDGREVAVKMLKDNKGDGDEFMNEVSSISRTSHVNVVTLLGFCLQGSKRALIYEYMPNGSLERYAFNSNLLSESSLTWEKLFDIAIGIARGLEYLHRGCNTRIVHFDIKPHNILLDQDFCPKISDFGLAKLCLNKESVISIGGARGTIGYIAPEVYSKQFGTVSSKSDVYSYGMMVLEMVGARDKKTANASSESSSQYFPQWIYDHLDDYCISASEINGKTTELVRKMIVVGLWCIQINPTLRPTMTRVVEMLEGSTSTLEPPPKILLT